MSGSLKGVKEKGWRDLGAFGFVVFASPQENLVAGSGADPASALSGRR